MATIEELSAALVKADAAGNTADAKVFADALRALKSQQPSAPIKLQGKVAPMADGALVSPSQNIEDRRPKLTARQGNLVGDLLGATAATANGIVNGVPILGPMVTNASDAIVGLGSMIGGGNYEDTVNRQRANRQTVNNDFQAANIAGNVAGGIGSFAGLGATAAGAEALGLTGGLGRQVANSAISTQGINTLDNMARGQAPLEATQNAVGGALLSGGVPIVSAGLRAGGRVVNDQIVTPLRTAFNQESEAIKRVGNAVSADTRAGSRMTPQQEAIAAQAGAPVINADRFGEATRRLARAASNISPEGGQALKGITEDRFYTQGKRAEGYVKQLMGGATDDLALQDALSTAAQRSNKINYEAAYNSPAAQKVFSPELQELLQSDAIQQAVKQVMTRGSNRAAIGGYVPIKDVPFRQGTDGRFRLIQKADGSLVTPNLAYWDQIKRNLDGMIGTAKRGGDNELLSDLMGLKRKLVGALDAQIPAYRKARQGAAEAFGAEDAIDIGRKAFSSGRLDVPELQRAAAKLTSAEKEAASVGYASEIIDRIRSAGDRVNVINSVFGNESTRLRNEIFLGPRKAKELEAYVRTEQILQQLKDAVGGNSTTAQQLIGAGILGSGTALWTGDAGTGLNVATLAFLGRRAAAMAGKKVDDKVMKLVADMLTSGDPAMVQKAINSAAMSQQHMDALDAITRGLSIGTRGLAMGSGAAMAEAS